MEQINSLYPTDKPKVTVEDLVHHLLTLPQKQEIVIYPKYDEVDGCHRHRFLIDNVIEQQQSDGYEYVAILF